MKQLVLALAVIFIFSGCSSDIQQSNINMEAVIEQLSAVAQVEGVFRTDMKQIEIAEEYGIAIDDMEEGYVLHSSNDELADRIVLVQGKDKDAVQNIERALSDERVEMEAAWEGYNDDEFGKVEKSILKTKGLYVILIVSDRAEEILAVFDEAIEKP